ncbi:hypothetical protein PT974_10335 [Cladobotryum mycophilum]|uniref:Uncharacterized protein n=1 Tax=Cladobotryum mycophilum TaxID=491253 RepID=A0ABR0S9K6_9HYPO
MHVSNQPSVNTFIADSKSLSLDTGCGSRGINVVTSSWGIGKKTPLFMIAPYATAIILAAAHFSLLRHLSGKPADGDESPITQSYLTTLSALFASAFGSCIRLSLSVAFTQYLWRLVRSLPMKISTIDNLFSLRGTPLLIFDPVVWSQAWPLVLMTIIMWVIPLATSLAPGASTVFPSSKIHVTPLTVPTFNASDLGNWTGTDWGPRSIASISWIYHFLSPESLKYNANWVVIPVQQTIERTLVKGELRPPPSPCKSDCSFATTFTGPYFQCESWTKNLTVDRDDEFEAPDGRPFESYFIRDWPAVNISYPMPNQTSKMANPPYNLSSEANSKFTIVTNDVIDIGVTKQDSKVKSKVRFSQRTLSCTPKTATYHVSYHYKNTDAKLDVFIDQDSVSPLTDVLRPLHLPESFLSKVKKDVSGNTGDNIDSVPLPIDETVRIFFQDSNLMTLLAHMALRLSGIITLGMSLDLRNGVLWNDSDGFHYYPILTIWSKEGIFNGPFLPLTQLCEDCTKPEGPKVHITEHDLNDALANITISAISDFGLWTSTVNVTERTAITLYSFSKPLHLILPYGISLLCALPFIAIGFQALRSNNVPAIDGGFFQLLLTTRGSPTIDRLAAGGCLSGEGNVPQALKDLKVRYGELIADSSSCEGGRVRRAGFGLEDEVVPLKRDYTYGYVEG